MVDKIAYSRGYRDPSDLQAMLDLVKKRPGDRATDFPGILDLQELLALPEIQASSQLWFDPVGQLACFALLDRDQTSVSVIFEVLAGFEGNEFEEIVFSWTNDLLRSTFPKEKGVFLLETRTADPYRIAWLERSGFERQPGGAVHMERALDDPILDPQLPAGFRIRPIHGEAEAEDWVRLHRAAHGTENMTTQYKLAMMQTPHSLPDMDLVAIAPDGRLAAYCVSFIDVEQNALTGQKRGHTDPVATHPDFQRRGLSKALMCNGLALLKQRGMEIACLGTGSENIAMIRTAESVAFHITRNVICFGKSIHIG